MASLRRGAIFIGLLLVVALLGWRLHGRKKERAAVDARTVASAAATAVRRIGPAAPLRLSDAVALPDESARHGVFEGRVVSAADRSGVAGAELTFARGGATTGLLCDREGRFRFEPAEAGAYVLAMATARGFLPFAPEWGQSPMVLWARAGERIKDVVLVLLPAKEYLGVVVDPEERPIAGAKVRLVGLALETASAPLPAEHVSDARGEFHFRAPEDALLEARSPRFAPARARLDRAAQAVGRVVLRFSGSDRPVEPQLLHGRVLDPQGAPAIGAQVVARFLADNPATRSARLHPEAQASTDEAGRFVLGSLDPGRYEVTAQLAGFAPGRGERVASGGAAASSELVLQLGQQGVLRGKVTDAQGKPVAAFTVLVLTRGLRRDVVAEASLFDARGLYEIAGLAAGEYGVQALARGYAPAKVQPVTIAPAPAEPTHANFSLAKGGTLIGDVQDAASGAPLMGAHVETEGQAGGESTATPVVGEAMTNAAGHFELDGLAAGPCSIEVRAEGHHSRILSGFVMPDSGSLGPVPVELSPVAPGETPGFELVGIGVQLAPGHADLANALVIGGVVPDGGAAEAGLVSGDAILSVDGLPVTELGFAGAISAIRGPEGTLVRLTVRRGEGASVWEVTVQRRKIKG